jgi:hypothetical protein
MVTYFSGIIPKYSVNDNRFFSFREPTVWPEPCFGLRWRWRHAEKREKSYKESEESPAREPSSRALCHCKEMDALNHEQPPLIKSGFCEMSIKFLLTAIQQHQPHHPCEAYHMLEN